MDKTITADQFRKWCLSQTSADYTIAETASGSVRLSSDYACGEVVFYDDNIVELAINDPESGENHFYLHFVLQDEAHAKDLFTQMKLTYLSLKHKKAVRVLLSCSSALTTSFFAQELNRTAEVLKKDYTFNAVSFDHLYEKGFDYDVILLAPQIHYAYDEARKIMKDQIVLKIPGAIFGTYNTGALFDLIGDALQKKDSDAYKPRYEASSLAANDYRILTLGMINHRGKYRFAYRIYDHGSVTLDNEVVKNTYDEQDIVDLLDYITIRHRKVDAISVAAPGIAWHGYLHNPGKPPLFTGNFGMMLRDKYGVPVMIINDANAMALGYSVTEENAGDMVFWFQPHNEPIPGAGVIMDGRLRIGKNHAAGELRPLIEKYIPDAQRKIMSPEGAMEIVTLGLSAYITTLAPVKIVLYSELTPDMTKLKEKLGEYIEEDYIPQIVHETHLKKYILAGAMLYALEVMQRPEGWHEAVDREIEEKNNKTH